jgi:hypothetical protein
MFRNILKWIARNYSKSYSGIKNVGRLFSCPRTLESGLENGFVNFLKSLCCRFQDLTLLCKTIRDNATAVNPWEPPTGIKMVLVNGQLVYDAKDGFSGRYPGQVLRRSND